MAPWMARRRLGMCSVCQAIQQIIAVWRVAHTISAPHHACARRLHIHAYLLPSSSLGPHSRRPSLASAVQHVTTCRASGSGALRRTAFSFLDISRLFRAAVASLLPWSARTHPDQLQPWSARTHHLPLRRLAPVSRSVGLSPTLSLPFSLASPSLSLLLHLSVPFPLRSTLSLSLSLSVSLSLSLAPSLSRPKKGGSGCSVHLYPPRGSNHPPRDRRGRGWGGGGQAGGRGGSNRGSGGGLAGGQGGCPAKG